VEVDAPAKANLFLRVRELEPSGYHEIVTLFQTLELADRVRVTLAPGSSVELDVSGLDAGPPERNLVLRAARAFLEAAGETHGLAIELEKRIPAGTGLGGASSDAAATLRSLDRLFPGRVDGGLLMQLAEGLGSDVSFFLCGSPLAEGRGRGEILVPLTPLPEVAVLLAFPPLHVSTAEAYQRLDRDRAETGWRTPAAASTFDARTWPAVARLGGNDFEASVFAAHPEVERARDALRATDPLFVSLSGSGSAVFAVYTDEGQAVNALAQLGGQVEANVVLTRTRRSVPPLKLL
jgi:4-diphosphocytidyl-2-C-methyl-D-erythritol kinase